MKVCISQHSKTRLPELHVEFVLSNSTTDIVGEGIDLAIRIGQLPDSSLVARKIDSVRLILSASPDFLKRYGKPAKPTDLTVMPCLVDTVPAHGKHWFVGKKIRVNSVIEVNNGEMIRDLSLQGLGISFLPDFFVDDDLKSGKLVQVLPEFEPDEVGVYAVFPPRRQISPNARAFTDWFISKQ